VKRDTAIADFFVKMTIFVESCNEVLRLCVPAIKDAIKKNQERQQ
jgi:hypothetical protein